GIVSKYCQPLLGNGFRIVFLLAFDCLDGKEVEGHTPSNIDVCPGWYEIGNVAGLSRAALDDDRLHVRSVSGKNLDGDSGYNLPASAQKFHLPSFNQGIVVLADVADAVACKLPACMLPLPFLHEILCSRKRRHNSFGVEHGVPTAMVEVQVCVDDDVDVVRSNPSSVHVIQQFRRLYIKFGHALGEFVPY